MSLEEVENMHEFHVRMDINLFERIKLLASKYHISINEMIIELLEIGYIKSLRRDDNESKDINRR